MKMQDDIYYDTRTYSEKLKDAEQIHALILEFEAEKKELEELRAYKQQNEEYKQLYHRLLTRLWDAVGIIEYTGISIIEHVEKLRDYKQRVQDALIPVEDISDDENDYVVLAIDDYYALHQAIMGDENAG